VFWSSQKQKSVALSTVEAEYMAGSVAVSYALWSRMSHGQRPHISDCCFINQG
jgi:hypothetical protein